VDDSYWGQFDIGFSFTYFGDRYTQFYVSSNGYKSLRTSQLEDLPL
jgi:hypothetical protein